MNTHQLSVRALLAIMVGLVLLAMLALAGVGLINTSRLDDALTEQGDSAQAVRRQMDADMMHDAIRSDVYAALLAAREGEIGKVTTIQQDLVTHTQRLKQNVDSNAKADRNRSLPPLNFPLHQLVTVDNSEA